MSGHSKWAGIKHKKAIVDAKRGKVFTRLANQLTIAAREGGDDPDMNFRLRLSIDKAKAANMPQANIQRAIDRGTGKGDGAKLEEITYEGYGPGGVAVMVKVLTDNRNRSAADIRSAFTKAGGKLGPGGAVAWMFEPKAIIRVSEPNAVKQEGLSLIAIEAGAVDVEMGDELIVYATPESLRAIQDQLKSEGAELASELTLEPKDSVQVNDEAVVKRIMSFLDALEEMDEVVETYSNFDTALELSEIE